LVAASLIRSGLWNQHKWRKLSGVFVRFRAASSSCTSSWMELGFHPTTWSMNAGPSVIPMINSSSVPRSNMQSAEDRRCIHAAQPCFAVSKPVSVAAESSSRARGLREAVLKTNTLFPALHFMTFNRGVRGHRKAILKIRRQVDSIWTVVMLLS
jgi:hypothetical protein